MQKHNYISNIDTLYFLTYFDNYDTNKSIELLLLTLKNEKEKAKKYMTENPSYKHLIKIADIQFEILPNGKRGYSFILKNPGYELHIAEFNSSISNFAPIQVRISSEYLWAYGLKISYQNIYKFIANVFGVPNNVKVSRVDMAMHIDNADFITNYQNAYKGNYKNSNVNFNNKSINALTFGSRSSPVYCRIYDKTLEIQEQSKKTWFYEIWKANNMDINNVWNVEFELKSDFLRRYNIISPIDLIEHLNSIWHYLTFDWLVMINNDNKRVDRCSTNYLWKIVQNGYSTFSSEQLIERNSQKITDALAAIPTITGYLTTYAAKRAIPDINIAIFEILQESENYLVMHKNSCLNNEIQKKIPLYTESEVTKYD